MDHLYQQYEPEDLLPLRLNRHYEHHQLKPRGIKTKDKIRERVVSSTPDSYNHTSSGKSGYSNFANPISRLNSQRKSILDSLKNQQAKQIRHLQKISKQVYGRQLFVREIQNNKNLGPGQYETKLIKSHSFGYITRRPDMENLVIRKGKPSKNIGPGQYAFENSEKLISNHKTSNGATFNSQKLVRCILPKQQSLEKLNLNLIQQQNSLKKQIWKSKLGPGSYQPPISKEQFSSSEMKKNNKFFTISRTERIPMVANQGKKLPGPGSYQWSTYYDSRNYKKGFDKKKPIIQYQFVYGHPS